MGFRVQGLGFLTSDTDVITSVLSAATGGGSELTETDTAMLEARAPAGMLTPCPDARNTWSRVEGLGWGEKDKFKEIGFKVSGRRV